MEFYDLLCECQSQSKAGYLSGASIVDTIETLCDLG